MRLSNANAETTVISMMALVDEIMISILRTSRVKLKGLVIDESVPVKTWMTTMTDLAFRNRFDRACELMNSGATELALKDFESLLKDLPDSAEKWIAGTHGVIGDIFLCDLLNYEAAIRHFELALRLRPKAEHASRGLFRALLAQGDEELAYREMMRFMAMGRCATYEEELEEITPSIGLRPLIEAAKSLVRANQESNK